MFFSTKIVASEWARQATDLSEYYRLVQGTEFDRATALIEKLHKECSDRKEALNDADPDAVYNDYYLFLVLLDLLKSYATYWGNLCKQKCSNSWDSLQDVQDLLRTLRRFGHDANAPLLNFIEGQCESLEVIYPYTFFASPEILVKSGACSICGKDPHTSDCPHLMGELYRGVRASRVAQGIEFLALGLVKNPEDKRCVVEIPEDAPGFHGVRYFAQVIAEGQITPFGFSRFEKRRIPVPDKSYDGIGPNALCPCGSGMKYKKCCLNKVSRDRDHIDVIGQKLGILESRRLSSLSCACFDNNP